jgi:hypothetical protein
MPVPGTAWSVSVEATSRSTDSPDAGGNEQYSTYHSDYRIEILTVDGPAPSRVKLRFQRNVHTYQGAETPTVIDGKEYVVDARAPHVRDATTGAAAPEEDTRRVLDVFPDLGTRTRIDEVLPEDAMGIGDRHDELAAAILRVIHPRAWTMRTGSATLLRVDGDHGVFAVSLDASSDSGLRLEVSGEAHVRLADARLSDLLLSGRYELQPKRGKNAGGPIEPPGTFTLRRRVTSDPTPRSDR